MKVLMLWKYYPQYLSYFYKKNPSASDLSFEEHRDKIFDDHFGWPAELSQYMNQQGIQTEFIIANAESLQKKWAEENNFTSYSIDNWEKEIAMEQIKRFQPDIFWMTDIFEYYGEFVQQAFKYTKKAITWVGSPFIKEIDVSCFSVLITENRATFQSIHDRFERIIVTKPAFDPDILEKIGDVEKRYDVTFIGGISHGHTKRAEILAYLIENGIDLKIFGYIYEQQSSGIKRALMQAGGHILKRRDIHKGIDALKSPFSQTAYQRNIEIIKTVHQGPVFGLDMYHTIAASRITLNVHIDVAGNHAGNMRMFETTGMGTCLLTEHSNNITELFEPGNDILTYKSKEELLEIIQKSLRINEKIEMTAHAGQKKTLQTYTFKKLFNDIKIVFEDL